MKMIYPSDYSFNVAPTDRREDMIKASSAEYLDGYTKEQIDKGIKFIREMKQDGEGKYHRLDVDLCIGAVRDANVSRAAHKALPAPEARKVSKEEALAALAAIKAETCPEPVKRIDTQDRLDISKIEAELLSGKVTERGN
jgi:hypothetical protein